LDVEKNNKLTKAAKYLFTKEHDIELQLAVFATKERLTFLDIKNYKLPLLDMLDTAESYIKEKLNWKVEFIDFKRVEIPEIPIKAIREALVNSLIHRDFSNPKGNEVAIFKDRIEIYNPGSFPKGLTPEDYIKKQERSY
jgi:ATP-dependent DNA helicase RecG